MTAVVVVGVGDGGDAGRGHGGGDVVFFAVAKGSGVSSSCSGGGISSSEDTDGIGNAGRIRNHGDSKELQQELCRWVQKEDEFE